MNSVEKVLLVDDEMRILEGLRRTLQDECEAEIAQGPEQGLMVLAESGPFAVVVSDLRMPVMDGVLFLAKAKAMFPDTVRIMLTGQADINSAIASVNEGAIFRFLTKPCPPMIFRRTISAALEQYRLITAERDLLWNTLMGAVTTLAEVLSLTQPDAFGHSFRIKHYVSRMDGRPDGGAWQFHVAATLSQLGCITLPAGICGKAFAGVQLPSDELRLFDRHPLAAAEILKEIPRFELVAQMIAWQNRPYRDYAEEVGGVSGRLVAAGAQMLHVAIDLEKLRRKGQKWECALESMRARETEYNLALLDALESSGDPFSHWTTVSRNVLELEPSMIADEDIVSRDGLVLAKAGEHLSLPSLERIRRTAAHAGVVEPIQMRIPAKRGETSIANPSALESQRSPQPELSWSSL